MIGTRINRVCAVEYCGEEIVGKVEANTCELTNRVGGNGIKHNDPVLEFAAVAKFEDFEGTPRTITVYYHATNAEEQHAIDNDCGVWDLCDPDLAYYVID